MLQKDFYMLKSKWFKCRWNKHDYDFSKRRPKGQKRRLNKYFIIYIDSSKNKNLSKNKQIATSIKLIKDKIFEEDENICKDVV